MTEIELPWYVALLGQPPAGELFHRLVSELDLTSDDDPDAAARWYENEDGISVVVGATIESIQLFSFESPHFIGFSGTLPLGLSFAMTREEVHRRLGQPDRVFPSEQAAFRRGDIERYRMQACVVMVEYGATSGRLAVLGFESPEPQPWD